MAKVEKSFGDRKDATRVKNINSLSQLSIDLKPGRKDSDVYINQKIDVTNLMKYLDEKKNNGIHYSFFHTIVTAIGKVFYNREKMNYFVANRHIYNHDDVIISFVAKVSFDDASEELMVLLNIEPSDTIETISQKITNKVSGVRKKTDSKKGANNAIDLFGKMPNIIRVPLVGAFKWMDKKGLLPNEFIKDNLYYSSIIVSNLGSLKCGAIYHNINDFGTCSSLATIGEVKSEWIINEKGKKEEKKFCEFGINIDERIADGYYFVKTVQLFQYILNNPKLLEECANEKIETTEIR